MLLEAGVPIDEILANLAGSFAGQGEAGSSRASGSGAAMEEMEEERQAIALSLAEAEMGEGAPSSPSYSPQEDGEEEGEEEGEEDGEEGEEEEERRGSDEPSSRDLRQQRRRRLRRRVEAQMEDVLDMAIEHSAPGDSARDGDGGDGDGADGEQDDDSGMSSEEEAESDGATPGAVDRDGDDDMLSDEDDVGLGYRSELLREAETSLLQLLHGEIDDGGLGNGGGGGIETQLTMMMNEDDHSLGSDSEDEDEMLLGDAEGGGGFLPEQANGAGVEASPGAGRSSTSATRALRASVGWPLPSLASPGEAGAGEASATMRREGSLLSRTSVGAFISTCGHATHVSCWHEYMSGLLRRVMQSDGFEGEGLVRPQRGEFVCPVCRRAANALLPLAPSEPPAEAAPEPEEPAEAEPAEAADSPTPPAALAAWSARALRYSDENGTAGEDAVFPLCSRELRAAIEHFGVVAAAVHGGLPRLGTPPHDARALLMPAALLAHNASVAELSSRTSSPRDAAVDAGQSGQSDAEAAAVGLKLRALWRLARARRRPVSRTAAALLRCAAASSAPPRGEEEQRTLAGNDLAVSGTPKDAPPSLRAQRERAARPRVPQALLVVEPFVLFAELVALCGLGPRPDGHAGPVAAPLDAHVSHAAAAALGVSVAQALAGAAASGRATAAEWGSALAGVADALTDDSASWSRLLCACSGELLWRMAHLIAALRRQPPPGPATGAEAAAAACASVLGVAGGCVAALSLVQALLRAAACDAPLLYQRGAAAVAATGLPTAALVAARGRPPAALLRTSLMGWELPPPPLGLVPLPASFEAFFHATSASRCQICRATPEHRAVCLACGATLCGLDTPHGSSAIIEHTATCGVGVGLFMLTHNSAVVLVRERRLLFVGSPYRDEHGEVDIGLLRMKPLTLHAPEYAALSRQWLNLNFDESARGEDELPLGL